MRGILFITVIVALLLVAVADKPSDPDMIEVKKVGGKKLCRRKGWECNQWSVYCCNLTISDYFQSYQFENLFSKRNTPIAFAADFWDYKSFITAAALFEPLGFGTTGDKNMQMREIAAFLGHVGGKTSCGYEVATGGPLAWGLCYKKELSPGENTYCDDDYKFTYPCSPGASYYGRGAIPMWWNFNYGAVGEALNLNLLDHPELVENNATIAFEAAILLWMRKLKKSQPSAHDVFVGNWKPTNNDTLAKRVPGFGATMNLLYGELTCGQGDIDPMNALISHYQYYCELMGLERKEAGPHDVLTCAEQAPFNPNTKKPASSS